MSPVRRGDDARPRLLRRVLGGPGSFRRWALFTLVWATFWIAVSLPLHIILKVLVYFVVVLIPLWAFGYRSMIVGDEDILRRALKRDAADVRRSGLPRDDDDRLAPEFWLSRGGNDLHDAPPPPSAADDLSPVAEAPVSSRQIALRPYHISDLDLLRSLLGDPEMTEFLGGPESEEAIAARHERYLMADPETNGIFTVLVDGEPAGWVGFWDAEWEGEHVWECGWHVLPAFQRAGVAVAAAGLLLEEAGRRGWHRFADAFPAVDNAASNRVCRRLRFLPLGEVDVEYPKGHQMHSMHWRFDLKSLRGE